MESSAVPPIEIGSLSALSPDDSQFIGSSSGVFFVNTVYRAFAKFNHSKQLETGDPAQHSSSQGPDQAVVDSCIVGSETTGIEIHGESATVNSGNHGTYTSSSMSYGPTIEAYRLGHPPSQELAKELIKTYFQSWHPLFPFLFGKTFLSDVELFYAEGTLASSLDGVPDEHKQVCRAATFQCVFNIAALDRKDLYLASECCIESSTAVLSMIGILASKHDLTTLQALLAIQLYLIATMSLQAASVAGGVLLRSLFHAGFHRCPFRYGQLSQHDCEIRKRIFWSAYIADRYLSQALGLPLGIQDSDIDVCVPGTEELHRPVGQPVHMRTADEAEEEVLSHLPQGHPDLVQTPSDGYQRTPTATPAARIDTTPSSTTHGFHRRPGEDVFKNYISYCRISGRALELFHKSIHRRAVNGSSILMLNSEINGWWNSLPYGLQDLADEGTKDADGSFAAFFSVIYQQLILLVNRPFLSRDPSSPEFRSSMQTCINSGRLIIQTLKDPKRGKRLFSWPGILSSVWMSGLVLAFACQLDLYPFSKGTNEIEVCLELLQTMGATWSTAQHCHAILKVLLSDLRIQFNDKDSTAGGPMISPRTMNQQNGDQRTSHSRQSFVNGFNTVDGAPSKRQRTSHESNYHPHYGGGGTMTSNSQSLSNPLRPPTQVPFQPFISQMQSMPSQQTSSAPGLNGTSRGDNMANVVNYGQGDSRIEESQWLNDPIAGAIYSETGDLLGQVSWESLFQGNGNGGDLFGWDTTNNSGMR